MISIAITGGIGTGKSTITDHLISKGYTVIDADKMSREMTAAGGKAMPYILEHFGPEYIYSDGSLNRVAMRDLVFRDEKYMKILEEGTTAVILRDIEKIKADLTAEGAKVMFFDIPLLFEKHQEGNYDEVWVVTADHDIRAARIMARDNIDPAVIELIIDSQAEEDHKISLADRVFYNNGTIAELQAAVDEALKEITE